MTIIKCRRWNLDKDYPILKKWFKEHKWESVVPKEMLPPQGIIIEDNEPICALGLYLNKKVKFGYMYGIFSNPKIGKIKLFKAMKMSIQEVKKLAKQENIEIILTHTAEKALEKLYTKYGDMEYGEKNVKSYIMNLNKKKYTNLDWLK
jgi:hypothetical protein|tara:strand:+ start:125 stop:568 length:444 start_codon:yes stop_codon:yes gene_type:complete